MEGVGHSAFPWRPNLLQMHDKMVYQKSIYIKWDVKMQEKLVNYCS